MCVVDPLEEVDVEHNAREWMVVSLRPLGFSVANLAECAPIEQPGERIGVSKLSLKTQSLERTFSLSDPRQQFVLFKWFADKVVCPSCHCVHHGIRFVMGCRDQQVDLVPRMLGTNRSA
jgi:hypothetical protein